MFEHALSPVHTLAPCTILAQGGGGGGWSSLPWGQIVVIAAFVLFSTISWIMRTLAEARKAKKAQDAARRRAEEALRTGRDPITGEPIAGSRAPVVEQTFSPSAERAGEEQRLREIAERRRRQMAEAQQRQQSGSRQPAGGAAGGAGGGGLVLTTDSSGRLIIARTEQAGTPRPGEGRQKKRKDQNRQRAGEGRSRGDSEREMLARRQAMEQEARRRQQLQALRQAEEAELRRPVPSAAEVAAAALEDRRAMSNPRQPNVGVSLAGIPQTPAEWRGAIIAAEVLGPPVSMRPPA